MTEAIHVHQCVQFLISLLCPQHEIIHIGFKSANKSPKNVCCRTGVACSDNPLCLRHKSHGLLAILLR